MKKKISLLGICLGLIAGALVALLAGSWIFWLASGIAIGVMLGSAAKSTSIRRDSSSHPANAGGANL
jgi:predicted lysophospholipase L1 biosynthesis ABC-type transport system permease subunit